MKNVIVFGPWTGEFSYEMNWWCPQLRKLKKEQFADNYVIGFSFTGRYGLYRDFIDEFVGYDQHVLKRIGYPECGISVNKTIKSSKYTRGDPIALRYMREWLQINNMIVDRRVHSTNLSAYGRRYFNLMGGKAMWAENPYGDYINLNARKHINDKINNKINAFFPSDKSLIAVMPRIRNRINEQDRENWNPKHWKTLLHKLINNLNVGIVLIGVPPRDEDGYPGAIAFDNIPNQLLSCIEENENAVEEQISILQNTKCSLYGASGAAFLAFFANTPSFIFSHSNGSDRLPLNWCKKLTGGHKQIRIYNTHKDGPEYYNKNPETVFNEFCDFYKGLG